MKKVLILAYHRILPAEKISARQSRGDTITLAISAEDFERQLQYLTKKGYKFTTLRELYSIKNHPLRHKYCVITFDDGYRDNYLYAWPILQKLKIPATLFMVTGVIGSTEPFYWDLKNQTHFEPEDYPLTWTELKELQRSGIEIGSHSHSHYELNRLAHHEQLEELIRAKMVLDQNLQQKTISICYPRGQADQNLLKEVAGLGYLIGVITPKNERQPETIFSLKRVAVYQHDSLRTFKLKISWLFSLYRRFRR